MNDGFLFIQGIYQLKWRKWNNILHRDIGYLAVGLTIIFAISGIAVNHVQDWNPNFSIEKKNFQLKPDTTLSTNQLTDYLVTKLVIDAKIESSFKPAPGVIHIFFENQKVEYNFETGQGMHEIVSERTVLHDFNFLHLNHPKKIWTYLSDLYALALLFLAISGMFVLKGRKGITGRGKWLIGIGVLIPILVLAFYKYY